MYNAHYSLPNHLVNYNWHIQEHVVMSVDMTKSLTPMQMTSQKCIEVETFHMASYDQVSWSQQQQQMLPIVVNIYSLVKMCIF